MPRGLFLVKEEYSRIIINLFPIKEKKFPDPAIFLRDLFCAALELWDTRETHVIGKDLDKRNPAPQALNILPSSASQSY